MNYAGNAYGSDPTYHHIADGAFDCSAPGDAKCRTSPTCECENWCSCDGSPEDAVDNHGADEHCCMTTTKPGQGCWLEPWVNGAGLDACDHNVTRDDEGEPLPLPDGPVVCDWEDGVCWTYVEETA